MRRIQPRILAAAALACVLGHARPSPAADVYINIPYPSPASGAPNASQLLDLYLPADTDLGGGGGGGNLPDSYTIVLVHGGGYSGGDKSEIGPICSRLADLGFVVISPNYRLLTSSMSSAGIGSFPQTTCDILNVVHWIRSDGQQIGLPDRVILGGFSAGSTIALNAAMGAGDPRFNVLPTTGPRGYTIDGAVGGFGRYDLTWNAQAVGMPSYVYQFLGIPWGYSGPTASSWLLPSSWAIFAQASAASLVDGCSPPSVLYHGDSDPLVPAGNSSRLQQTMLASGAPVQLNLIPGGTHDYSVFGSTWQAQAQSIAGAAVWIAQHAQPGCGRSVPPAFNVAGACCAPDGSCTIATPSACGSAWVASQSCTPNPCPQPPVMGACCDGDGACSVSTESACASDWSAGSGCAPNNCPQPPPRGSCCLTTGSCMMSVQSVCAGPWTMQGACSPNVCTQPPAQGACCAADGSCTASIQSACAGAWIHQGNCSPNVCSQSPPPPQHGACCMGSICQVRPSGECGPGQRFISPGAACNAPGAHTAPCCHADFNQDGQVLVADIFEYLNAWFAGDPRTVVSGNFAAGPSVAEIFEYLNVWFSGC